MHIDNNTYEIQKKHTLAIKNYDVDHNNKITTIKTDLNGLFIELCK